MSKNPLKSEVDEAVHQVAEAKAKVTQVNAELQLAAKQFERTQQMLGQGLIARSEFDSAQSNQASMQSRLQAAKATLKVR